MTIWTHASIEITTSAPQRSENQLAALHDAMQEALSRAANDVFKAHGLEPTNEDVVIVDHFFQSAS